jgi:aryl-alcohol dehydrogenase-like predicted oxidoreductase
MTDRELGRTGIRVSPIGLGTWQFGGPSRMSSAFFPAIPQAQIDVIIQAALDGGITSFDTAQLYGNGHAERSLASGLLNPDLFSKKL